MAGLPFLWKGAGEHTGKGLVMLPGNFNGNVFIAGPDGKPIQNLQRDTTRHVPEPGDPPGGGEFGQKYLAPAYGGQYGQGFLIGVTQNGQTQYVKIDNGAAEYRGHIDTGEGTLDNPASIAQIGGATSPFQNPYLQSNLGAYGMLPGVGGLQFNPVNFNPINFKPIKSAPYNFVDPITAAQKYNAFNTGQEQNAFNTGMQRGQQLTNLDQATGAEFAQKQEGLQQGLVGSENAFNQQQRLSNVNTAMPGLQGVLDQKQQIGQTLASGKLLSSAEDRAYELAARSASADGNFTRGFGDNSVFGRTTSDLLSAQQRLGLTQAGEGMLNDWITQGSSILIDNPLKATISQALPSTPQILASQQASQQQSELTNLTTVPTQFGISSEINQQQFTTGQEQGTRQFNASTGLAAQQFNSSSQLGAQEFNSQGQFGAAVAQFQGLQGNFQLATGAAQYAQQNQQQLDQNAAAASAANANINAQHNAANTGAIAQVGGAIIGAGISAFAGGMTGGAGGAGAGGAGGAASGLGGVASAATAALGALGLSAQVPAGSPTGQQLLQTVQGAPQTRSAQVPQSISAPVLSSGAPSSYLGSQIPTSSGQHDSVASPSQISQGYRDTGNYISNLGASGANAPQMMGLGRAMQNAGSSAGDITSQFPSVNTPQAQSALVDSLHQAASNNAPTPESAQTADQIFSQVREHFDTGAGISGQAAGIAGFVHNYNQYSGPEKARGIANIAFAGQDLNAHYGVKDLSSESIGKIPVPGTNNRMNVQDAMSLASSGYNVHSLVNNWEDINEIHNTVAPNSNGILNVAMTARNLGLLGNDTPQSINQRKSALTSIGATPASAWGSGAVSVPSTSVNSVKSLGYSVVGKTAQGQSVALPKEALGSTGRSMGVVGSGTNVSSIPDSQNAMQVSHGAAQVYNNWSRDYIPRSIPQMGEHASVAQGLYKLGSTDPFLLGNVITRGISSSNTGNPQAAITAGQNLGLFDGESNITLASGEKINASDFSTLQENKQFGSTGQLMGTALSTVLGGSGTDPSIRQLGSMLGAAGTYKANDFSTLQKNMQGMYQQAGISTKDDAYALTNQAFNEGRISQFQKVIAQQGANLTFDPAPIAENAAQQLMEGFNLGSSSKQSDYFKNTSTVFSPPDSDASSLQGLPNGKPPSNSHAPSIMAL